MFIISSKTIFYMVIIKLWLGQKKVEMVTEYRYFQRVGVRISLLNEIEECFFKQMKLTGVIKDVKRNSLQRKIVSKLVA